MSAFGRLTHLDLVSRGSARDHLGKLSVPEVELQWRFDGTWLQPIHHRVDNTTLNWWSVCRGSLALPLTLIEAPGRSLPRALSIHISPGEKQPG